MIKSIDRLGRNYTDIQDQWRIITKEKRAHIVVLDMPLLDTRHKERDLTGTFIADLVFADTLLCRPSRTVRISDSGRQKELLQPKAKGVRFGREKKLIPRYSIHCRSVTKTVTSPHGLQPRRGVAHSTFLKWIKTSKKLCKNIGFNSRLWKPFKYINS